MATRRISCRRSFIPCQIQTADDTCLPPFTRPFRKTDSDGDTEGGERAQVSGDGKSPLRVADLVEGLMAFSVGKYRTRVLKEEVDGRVEVQLPKNRDVWLLSPGSRKQRFG